MRFSSFEDMSSKDGFGSFGTTTGEISPVSRVGSAEGAFPEEAGALFSVSFGRVLPGKSSEKEA